MTKPGLWLGLLLLSDAATPSAADILFTNRAREAFNAGGQLALRNSQPEFGVFHLAFVLFDARELRSVVDPRAGPSPLHSATSIGAKVAGAAGADALEISHKLERAAGRAVLSVEPSPTKASPGEDLKRTLLLADKIRDDEGDTHVALHHLLLACAKHDGVAAILKQAGLDNKVLRRTVAELRGGPIESAEGDELAFEALLTYGVDMVETAQRGKLDPVIGREEEIRRVIQVLCRRRKNNPLLLGEPGVGKTAIVEGLAQRIVSGDVPRSLADCHLVSLDMAALVAGTSQRGQFEYVMSARPPPFLLCSSLHLFTSRRASSGSELYVR